MVLASAGLATAGTEPVLPATSATCPALLIPMYGGRPDMWRQLTSSPPRATTAIANLGNGPGRSRDAGWATRFAAARAAGIRVIGYVYTRYGKRSLPRVKRDIARWERWYPIDGIFVDNLTSNREGNLRYYTAVSASIRRWRAHFIVMNGWATREYMALTDVLLPFEGPLWKFKTFRTPEWTRSFHASRFANIVYGVPNRTAMRSVLDTARQRGLGMLYVTNRPASHPYFRLPSFLRTQDDYLRRERACETVSLKENRAQGLLVPSRP
jgi:hypothetical protein